MDIKKILVTYSPHRWCNQPNLWTRHISQGCLIDLSFFPLKGLLASWHISCATQKWAPLVFALFSPKERRHFSCHSRGARPKSPLGRSRRAPDVPLGDNGCLSVCRTVKDLVMLRETCFRQFALMKTSTLRSTSLQCTPLPRLPFMRKPTCRSIQPAREIKETVQPRNVCPISMGSRLSGLQTHTDNHSRCSHFPQPCNQSQLMPGCGVG